MTEHEVLSEMVEVHANLSGDEYSDIARHGANAGWPNFTYTKDCCEFFDNNEEDIVNFLNEEADAYGLANMFTLMMENTHYKNYNYASLDDFKNWAAWYVLETVAHNKQME